MKFCYKTLCKYENLMTSSLSAVQIFSGACPGTKVRDRTVRLRSQASGLQIKYIIYLGTQYFVTTLYSNKCHSAINNHKKHI